MSDHPAPISIVLPKGCVYPLDLLCSQRPLLHHFQVLLEVREAARADDAARDQRAVGDEAQRKFGGVDAVQRHAQAGGASADDDEIPGLRLLQPQQQLGPGQRTAQTKLSRFTAARS